MKHGCPAFHRWLEELPSTVGVKLLVALMGVHISVDFMGVRGLSNLWVSRFYQYFTNAEPQVKPPPNASINRVSPGFISPSFMPTSRASGIEAAEVLPWSWTV